MHLRSRELSQQTSKAGRAAIPAITRLTAPARAVAEEEALFGQLALVFPLWLRPPSMEAQMVSSALIAARPPLALDFPMAPAPAPRVLARRVILLLFLQDRPVLYWHCRN